MNARGMDKWWSICWFSTEKNSKKINHQIKYSNNVWLNILFACCTYNRQAVFLRSEQVTRFTLHSHAAGRFIVFNRAYEKLILTQEIRENESEYNSCKTTTNKPFPSLLWAEFNQRRSSKEEAKQIRHHIVTHNHRNRHNEPNQSCGTNKLP